MDALIKAIEAPHLRKNLPSFRIGDTIRVHQRIREGGKERIQVFEGIVIAQKHGQGMSGTFTVRRIASGVGVERVFPVHSPMIAKIERMRSAKVRRAKLYFLRGRIGKRAKLKGWEAYASWEEAANDGHVTDDNDPKPTETDETTPTTAEETVESKEIADDSSPQEKVTNNDTGPVESGQAGRESRSDAAVKEGAPDSPEKSNE